MRICFVSHGSSSYGAERSLAEIVARAVVAGHGVDVYPPGSGPLEAILVGRGVPATAIEYATNRRWVGPELQGRTAPGQLARALVDVVRFLRILRAGRPDVVVVNTSVAPAAMLAGRLARLPVVTLVRESLFTNPSLMSPLPRRLILGVIRRSSSVVVSNSSFTARQVGGTPIVVYPPVGCCRTDPGPVRERTGPLRLISLGRFTWEKGQLDLVIASLRARAAGHDVELDLYGDDDIEPAYARSMRELIATSRQADAIRMHPLADDVAPLLRAADASVVTSISESFGRVTVESLQCNVPVIGYDLAGTSEILGGGGGVLVKPTPEDLEAEIVKLSTSPELLTTLKREAAEAGERWRSVRSEEELLDIIERAGGDRAP